MTKHKLIFVALAVALAGFLFAGSASAQDGQTMTVDPASVPEAGTYDFTISASGFTVSSVNLAVCNTGDTSLITDMAGLTQYCGGLGVPVSLEGGTYSDTIEDVEVGEDGVTFLLFQLVPDGESASASVMIGGDMDDMDMLPNTGSNAPLIAVIAVSVLLAGLMVLGLSRRLRTL